VTASAIRVLHVDDEETNARAKRVLEGGTDRLRVETASTVADGIERFTAAEVDCVVASYRLPDCDGVELLRRVRELDGDVPFVLFTDRGSERVASEAVSAGVTEYVPRRATPESLRLLADRVAEIVEARRTEARFEAFLELTPDATCVVDGDGVVTAVNPQLEALFGYDRSELVGEPVERLVPERYRDGHVEYREQFVESPERRPMGVSKDLTGLRSDGSEFPIDISLSPIRVGGHLEVIGAIRDVTERRRRQRRLERQNDRLEEFVDVVSHDLRNPLQVASGKLELARERDDDALLDEVERAHERMDALVDDLLTLARQGEFVGEPTALDVERTARRAWANVATCECDLDVERDIGSVLADESRLLELFENLYRNAVEHAGTDANVTIGTLEGGFYVADDGPGVPEKRRDAAFDRGYTSDAGGTGLGLAIVRRIVEAHGWTVALTESADGGARFEVTTARASDALLPE